MNIDYPLTNSKILISFKLKAFADDNFKVAQMVHFFYDRRKHCKKGKDADNQQLSQGLLVSNVN